MRIIEAGLVIRKIHGVWVITHHNHNMVCNKPKDKKIVYDYDGVFAVYGVWLVINGV